MKIRYCAKCGNYENRCVCKKQPKPKKPAKCPICEGKQEGYDYTIKEWDSIREKHWEHSQPKKPSKNPAYNGAQLGSKPAKDTTITISGNKIYLYDGFKPMRTFTEGVKDERGRIGLEFKKWFNSKKAEDIEDAIKRITGVNPLE